MFIYDKSKHYLMKKILRWSNSNNLISIISSKMASIVGSRTEINNQNIWTPSNKFKPSSLKSHNFDFPHDTIEYFEIVNKAWSEHKSNLPLAWG